MKRLFSVTCLTLILAGLASSCAGGYLIRNPKSGDVYYSANLPKEDTEDNADFIDCRTGDRVTLQPYAYRYLYEWDWEAALTDAPYCRSTEGRRQGCRCGE